MKDVRQRRKAHSISFNPAFAARVLCRLTVRLGGGERLGVHREDDARTFSGQRERLLYGRRRYTGVDGCGPVALLYADSMAGPWGWVPKSK